jgi:short-subunit dehydrogenase
MELAGASVVVTGASRGIGRATALQLAEAGAAVVAVGLDRDALRDLTATTGGVTVEADVRDPSHAVKVLDVATSEFGKLDAVVANAGIGYAGEFATMPVQRISDLLDVNLRAPMLLAREAAPLLTAQGSGSLVFVTSIAGVVPVPFEAAYCSTKTAIESFAEALRAELAPRGVSVSTVRPGVVRTAFHDSRELPYTRRYPRLMPPERVASAILDVLRTGVDHRTVPRWLDLAGMVRSSSPWLYRSLSRHFG